ncbi:MAG: hypothetical protein EOP11_18855 [Proteobacteria bacterium]|nr:MAG: hypothetical protein EOP11_18855 [Pseudomonadota bacterium]
MPSLFLLGFLCSLGQGFLLARRGVNQYWRIEASQAVRRIAENSYRYFEGRRPPSGEAFWAAVGKPAPLRDPWGEEYRMEHLADGSFLCRSAGEDRRANTSDDIIHLIPYGQALDTLQPRKMGQDPNLNPPPEQRVRDAK